MFTSYEKRVEEILEKSLKNRGINVNDDLTIEEVSIVEELTKDAQDIARNEGY